jgi:uncharacterized membrane protein required for colicin V production
MFKESVYNAAFKCQASPYVACRYSKKIASEVAEWTEYMRNKTGAVFFVMCAYTDEDGSLSIGR